ncbi:MAG: lipid-A-disaccharide synthase N-terminal domain-containing protein [Ginsengibacter sp.]
MTHVQLIGLAGGILTSFSSIPQLMKIIKEKEVEDISVGMVLVLITGISVWIYYGVLRNDWPVILTNSFSFIVNVLLLILYMKYKK